MSNLYDSRLSNVLSFTHLAMKMDHLMQPICGICTVTHFNLPKLPEAALDSLMARIMNSKVPDRYTIKGVKFGALSCRLSMFLKIILIFS
jgi:hypothetical protein